MKSWFFMIIILAACFGCDSSPVPVFHGTAYSPNEILYAKDGEAFEVSLIDPDGITVPKDTQIPLLWNHDKDKILGHCEVVYFDDSKRLKISGVISQYQTMPKALREDVDKLIYSQKHGYNYQLSIGGVTAGQFDALKVVPFGKKINFYGKVYEGPLLMINKFVLREVSIVTIGSSVETEIKIERKK